MFLFELLNFELKSLGFVLGFKELVVHLKELLLLYNLFGLQVVSFCLGSHLLFLHFPACFQLDFFLFEFAFHLGNRFKEFVPFSFQDHRITALLGIFHT